MPQHEFSALLALADDTGAELRRSVPALSQLLPDVDALVCMGGYNTLVEAVAYGVPTVCVPRTTPRTEQLIRARAFERLGLVRVVEPSDFTQETLAHEVADAIRSDRSETAKRAGALELNGAARAAAEIASLARRRVRPAQGEYVAAG